MSKRFIGELQTIFKELDGLVQDGRLKVDNSRDKEIDDDVLEDMCERVKRLSSILMLLEPRLPEVLPKHKRDEIANLKVMKAAAKCVNSEKSASGEKSPPQPAESQRKPWFGTKWDD